MPDGQEDTFAPVVMAGVEPANTGMVICVIDPTDAACKADSVTSTGTPIPSVVLDEVTLPISVTGLPRAVELPDTDTSGI